ncbi:MAG: HU family DNA-binding protein [Erysipelotrichaceae bacterium]|nr:HU family DNA-binding protein [Erysipelotrichaceae bacterium]
MNKSEIVAIVADQVNLTRKDAELAIDSFLEAICDGLSKGDKVVVSGFGTFEVRTRIARSGRNPRTGEEIVIPGQKTPCFKAGKLLKDAVKD